MKWPKRKSLSEPVEPYSWAEARYAGEFAAHWERRLRGYSCFPSPVELEPAFFPFDIGNHSYEEYQGAHLSVELAHWRLLVPVEQKVSPVLCEALLGSLHNLEYPISLEIIGDIGGVTFCLSCAKSESHLLRSALHLAFPLSSVRSPQKGLDPLNESLARLQSNQRRASANTDSHSSIGYSTVHFALGASTLLPLLAPKQFFPDPLQGLVGVLGALENDEVAGIQLLLSPARAPWRDELLEVASLWPQDAKSADKNGGSSTAFAQAIKHGLPDKLATPLWAAVLRAFAVVRKHSPNFTSSQETANRDSWRLCQRVGFAIPGCDSNNPTPDSLIWEGNNGLIPLNIEGYSERDQLLDILGRRSRLSGMLLSSSEVATLWHPPHETLRHPRLHRTLKAAPELPSELANASGIELGVLGTAPAGHGQMPVVRWPDAWRTRHFYILGATRMGKSTLLLNMMAQDMEAGRGLCLIDPHGDLARDVLARVPEHRIEDAYFLNLSDTEYPPAIGLLQARDEWEKRLLVSDLLSIFKRLFTSSWGDKLEHILRHALLTLLADDSGSTSHDGKEQVAHSLRDVKPLLNDESYRARVLANVRDRDLLTFWDKEFVNYKPAELSPIYNKLGLLFSSPLVRNIVGSRTAKLHFGELMQNKKILLVDLSSGLIGNDNAHFLGALLVSRLQLAAMHTLRLKREERTPFTLYVDEFQSFVVSSFETILSEAGKAGLEMVMANQFLEQLPQGLQTAILSNVGAMLSFKVSANSGRLLEKEFGGVINGETLVDLGRGQTATRIGRAGNTIRMHTFPMIQSLPDEMSEIMMRVIQIKTRQQLCQTYSQVEKEIFSTNDIQ